MSSKDKAINILNSFDETQMDKVLIILESLKSLADDDDIFCKELYEDYLNSSDDDKQTMSLNDFAKELNIEL